MNGQRTVGRYRAIDLTLFAVMLAVFEWIVVTAATRWFPNEPYTVSVVPAVTAIVMFRWGPWAAIHAVLGGLALCRASGATGAQYVIYGAGNLLSLLSLLLIKGLGGREKTRDDVLKTLLYGLATVLLMQLGRALVSLFFGTAPAQAVAFFTTDVISDLFTLVIVWIARRLDGMLENQYHYLVRVQREQEEERGGYR